MTEVVTQERLSFASERIELVGPPRKCVGAVLVHNPEGSQVKLRRLRLRTTDERLAGCGGALEVRTSAPLCAGESRFARVRVALPAGTPPGEYQALLDCVDESPHVVRIRVLEQRKVRVDPKVVALGCVAGETVRLSVTVHNLGNVPLVIPARAVLELHVADRIWTHYFHAAVRSLGERGYERVFDSFARRMHRDEPPLGRARASAGAGTLAPQQARQVEFELMLPRELRARRRYRAVVRLGGAAVRVALQVSAAQPNQATAR